MKKIIYLNGEETKYIITENGDIYNTKTGMKLSTKSCDNDGYPLINLTHKGKHYTFNVHRLVGLYFIPNPENKPELHHIDRNRKNFNYMNLMWCTRKEHFELERMYVEKFKRAKGEKNGLAKYSDAIIRKAAIDMANGDSRVDVKNRYGIDLSTLHKVYHRINWTHVTDDIVFPELNTPKRDVYTDTIKCDILNLLKRGYKVKEIIEILNLNNTPKIKNYIKTMKHRNLNIIEGSTTIESEDDNYYNIIIT